MKRETTVIKIFIFNYKYLTKLEKKNTVNLRVGNTLLSTVNKDISTILIYISPGKKNTLSNTFHSEKKEENSFHRKNIGCYFRTKQSIPQARWKPSFRASSIQKIKYSMIRKRPNIVLPLESLGGESSIKCRKRSPRAITHPHSSSFLSSLYYRHSLRNLFKNLL